MQNDKKIWAGIVTYNPNIARLRENIATILPQIEGIICVDNNSKNIDEIQVLCATKNNIMVVQNRENKGIAAALNQIMINAAKMDAEWVLTLDQDSVCSLDLIEKYSAYLNQKKVGIITPRIVDRNTEGVYEKKENVPQTEIVDKCITSASLMNMQVWKTVGGFDETMFIDFVDFDYCYCMRKKGYCVLKVNNVELLHQLGDIRMKYIFGLPVRVSNHSAFRNYYYARNAIYMFKKHHAVRYPVMLFVRMAKILLYEKDKKDKIISQWKGMWDGLQMKVNMANMK